MVKLYGILDCPYTKADYETLLEKGVEVDFRDLGKSIKDLKTFILMRDDLAEYDEVKANRKVGVPTFVLEDGTVTRDVHKVLEVEGK